MPVGRIHRYMRKATFGVRIGGSSSVYMAGVLEYLLVEVLFGAGDICREMQKKRLTPQHISLAIRQDEDLSDLLCNVTIPQGGVIPFIEPVLLPLSKRQPPQDDLD